VGKTAEIKKAIQKNPKIWVSYDMHPRGAMLRHGNWAPTKRSWNGTCYEKGLPYLGLVMSELREIGIYCESWHHYRTRRSRARGMRHGGIPRRVRHVFNISESDGGA